MNSLMLALAAACFVLFALGVLVYVGYRLRKAQALQALTDRCTKQGCPYTASFHLCWFHAPNVTQWSLEKTLQALYDSEINATITTLWDGGWDLSLHYIEGHISIWRHDRQRIITVRSAAAIADALHKMALEQYPHSEYARLNGGRG